MTRALRRALPCLAALLAVAPLLAASPSSARPAEDGDPWRCSHGSSASPRGHGSRDSQVTFTDPDNGERVGMSFTAADQRIRQWNRSDETTDYYGRFYSGNRIVLTWHWNLEKGMADHTYRFDQPRGQKVQLEVTFWQPSKGACVDNGGVT
ncbi:MULTISPECIES: hypothetical protein [unclassified Streptomyces]|uniref:hypothetical protein n=1 Tax=unclassified Streptomyces TaxID=2593676 RepID=UPI0004C5A528|nr:hypothetical protein [Streptomyces sp. NRRL F-5727]